MPSTVIVDYVYKTIPNTLQRALSTFDVVVYGRVVEVDVIETAGSYRWSFVLYKVYIKNVYKGMDKDTKYFYIAYIGGFHESKGILKYDINAGYFKVGQELIFLALEYDPTIPSSITRKFRDTYRGTEFVIKVFDKKIIPNPLEGIYERSKGKEHRRV